jgi:integrase
MKTDTKKKTWKRTRTPGLLRHRGGGYYGRFSVGRKTKFVALKCTKFEIARKRFAEEKAKVERIRKAALATEGGVASMGQLTELYRESLRNRQGLKEPTRARLLQHVKYIEKTWDGFAKLGPDEVTLTAVDAWKNHAIAHGTGYRPPGAKGSATRGRSAYCFNAALDTLRRLLDIAVDKQAIHANVLLGRRGIKAPYKPKKPQLPETAKLREIFAAVENGTERGGWSVETADFLRFLAFTGCRLKEAALVRWQDVDFGRGVIRVTGTKTAAATREVPIIPVARELLDRIVERRRKSATLSAGGEPHVDPAAPVLAVREGQKSLNRACETAGVPRLTHHDLRDVFATTCIESGIDIPTVAAWLGHADGGALLMRVYAHHRRAHSVAQAAKVAF